MLCRYIPCSFVWYLSYKKNFNPTISPRLRKLSEMSLEELWELFPNYLTEHQDCWSKWYEEEQNILKRILPTTKLGLQIYHIGSTAIHGIWAKPIVDILIEISNAATLIIVKELMIF